MSKLEEHKNTAWEKLAAHICGALLKKGYTSASFARTADDARNMVLGKVPPNCSVGVPGSVTVRQLGLIEALEARGCTVHQHWGYAYTFEDKNKQNMADWYVTSSNAITRDGMLVNVDGQGNRVAAMAWGNNEIIYVIGMNKVTATLEEAMRRAHTAASPANALRTGTPTPCTKTGYCMDCNSPDRTCRAMLILERAPQGRTAHVILIGQTLGY